MGLGAGAGCTRPPSDAERYLAGLSRPTDPTACLGISEPRLYGECVTMALVAGLPVDRPAADPAATVARCEAIPEGPWRDECAFLLADELGLRGDAAVAACEAAGRLRAQCLGHAIQREVTAALRDLPVGGEREALSRVEDITSSYLGRGPDARSRARQLLEQAVSQRAPGAPFSSALCGALEPTSCLAAFRQRTTVAALAQRPRDPEPWRIACARTVSVERATSLGLPGWTADFAPQAAEVWASLCHR